MLLCAAAEYKKDHRLIQKVKERTCTLLETALETPKMSLDPDENLAVVSIMAAELHSLLLNDAIFRTIMVEGPSGRKKMLISCGGLLARLHRLQHQREQITLGQRLVLDTAQLRTDETIRDLQPAFQTILQREAKARLDEFGQFLDEGEQDRAYFFDEYSIEMRNRQRLEEIIKELGDDLDKEVAQALAELDKQMRTLCRSAAFIWEAELEPIYPADRYWYLYLEPDVE